MLPQKVSFSLKFNLIFLLALFGSVLVGTAFFGVYPAQAQAPITAKLDRSTVAADDQLVLTVTVSGDFLTIPQPELPDMDFVVVGSSKSTQVSIVNGKMTSQGVFIYRLQPLAEGALEIPPVSVNIGGQVFQSDPVEVEVLAGGAQISPPPTEPNSGTPHSSAGQDYFVEAEVDNDTPYLGQQVIYTFRLYQAINFFGQPDYRPPSFTDFWSSDILDQPHYNADVNGRNYLVTEIRTAVFPANLGQITIEPSRLVIPGGLFNPDVKLEANPVTVNVRPLPENPPDDFSGAVGQFQISASLSDDKTKVNEPLMLVVEVEGVGNIETITEPPLPEMTDWRFFESQSSTSVDTSDGVLQGMRRFERLIVPGRAGEQEVPPIRFSFYNPQADEYQTAQTGPIPVTVLPDDSAQTLPLVSGVDPRSQQPVELLGSDIQHIKPVPFALSTPRVLSAAGQVVYWSLWVLPLFVMGAAFVWKRRQVRLEQNPAYARALFAKKKALELLSEAQHNGAGGATAAGRALLGYLSDKINAPTVGLTTNELLALLNRRGVPAELVDRVRQVLQRVDVGRFAPVSAGDQQAIIAETRMLIGDLEKSFGKPR